MLKTLVSLLAGVAAVRAATVPGTGDYAGIDLDVNRYPALWSGDFADCQAGGSLFNFTKFDTAYYGDNETVVFHMDGSTSIRKEAVMLYLTIEAYGETRFSNAYEPCGANITSLCPLNASQPIQAYAALGGIADIIPSVGQGVPDFEGLARLQIFANSTKTQIGCLQANMINGRTLSQPAILGSVTGVLTLFAVVASFLTSIYGVSVKHMRMHYAHSFSVFLLVETFQSFFLGGALTVDWPSVLPAWWSNFAWSVGIIANNQLTRSISAFTGTRVDVTQVGGAGSVVLSNQGGLLNQIYGRALNAVTKRINDEGAASNEFAYTWAGSPQGPGMPMPGTWPGFPGTLSRVSVPPTEAFTLSLIWFAVLLLGVVVFVVFAKFMFDLLIMLKWTKTDGYDYFRQHLVGFLATALLRTAFVAFFALMTTSLYQLALHGSAGPTAVAALLFIILFAGLGGVAAYALYFRFREGKFEKGKDVLRVESSKKFPFVSMVRESTLGDKERAEAPRVFAALSIPLIKHINNDPERKTVHDDDGYVKRFGWLSARYRKSRWGFFAFYLVYSFARACFLGAGFRSPLAQVFGFFLLELIAASVLIACRPFEGSRNNTLAAWLLSICKVVTAGLSIAFLHDFHVSRAAATVIGIIIVVVQAFVAVAALVLVGLGIFSTWMSLSRNREEFFEEFSGLRVRWLERMDMCAEDMPRRAREAALAAQEPAEHTFAVSQVRRAPKIEDDENVSDLGLGDIERSVRFPSGNLESPLRSRANSASSRFSVSSLPKAAKGSRASWSSKEYAQMQAEALSRPESMRHSRTSSLKITANISSLEESLEPAEGARRPMTPTRESLEGERVANDVEAAHTPSKAADVPALKDEEQALKEEPIEEKPVEEKAVEEKPVEEKPVEEKPVEEKPAEEKPADVLPVEPEATKAQ